MLLTLHQVGFQSLSPIPGAGRWLLQPLDLAIAPGEQILLVGPSGSGKTLLLRLLNGLVSPSQGRIQAGDQVLYPTSGLTATAMQDWRRRIVAVLAPTSPEGWPRGTTVHEAIAAALDLQAAPPWPWPRRRATRDPILSTLSQALNLEPGDRPLTSLSPGEHQRLAIATALTLTPKLLLLDEPVLRAPAQPPVSSTQTPFSGLADWLTPWLQPAPASPTLGPPSLCPPPLCPPPLCPTTIWVCSPPVPPALLHACDRLLYLQSGYLRLDQPLTPQTLSQLQQLIATSQEDEWEEEWEEGESWE